MSQWKLSLAGKSLSAIVQSQLRYQQVSVINRCVYLNSLVNWSCGFVFCLQVSLMNSKGVELCDGVVLGRHSVLTSNRCLLQDSESELRPSNLYVVTGMELSLSIN